MSSEFEKNQEARRRRNSLEGAEASLEAKEKQAEEAEKKMAAKERIEAVGKEVKSTKNQIQNIVANMAAVVKAVAAIRAQLQIQHDEEIPSLKHDTKALEALKKKLANLYSEIKDLKAALLAEEAKSVREEHKDWPDKAVAEEAKERVAEILRRLGLEN